MSDIKLWDRKIMQKSMPQREILRALVFSKYLEYNIQNKTIENAVAIDCLSTIPEKTKGKRPSAKKRM